MALVADPVGTDTMSASALLLQELREDVPRWDAMQDELLLRALQGMKAELFHKTERAEQRILDVSRHADDVCARLRLSVSRLEVLSQTQFVEHGVAETTDYPEDDPSMLEVDSLLSREGEYQRALTIAQRHIESGLKECTWRPLPPVVGSEAFWNDMPSSTATAAPDREQSESNLGLDGPLPDTMDLESVVASEDMSAAHVASVAAGEEEYTEQGLDSLEPIGEIDVVIPNNLPPSSPPAQTLEDELRSRLQGKASGKTIGPNAIAGKASGKAGKPSQKESDSNAAEEGAMEEAAPLDNAGQQSSLFGPGFDPLRSNRSKVQRTNTAHSSLFDDNRIAVPGPSPGTAAGSTDGKKVAALFGDDDDDVPTKKENKSPLLPAKTQPTATLNTGKAIASLFGDGVPSGTAGGHSTDKKTAALFGDSVVPAKEDDKVPVNNKMHISSASNPEKAVAKSLFDDEVAPGIAVEHSSDKKAAALFGDDVTQKVVPASDKKAAALFGDDVSPRGVLNREPAKNALDRKSSLFDDTSLSSMPQNVSASTGEKKAGLFDDVPSATKAANLSQDADRHSKDASSTVQQNASANPLRRETSLFGQAEQTGTSNSNAKKAASLFDDALASSASPPDDHADISKNKTEKTSSLFDDAFSPATTRADGQVDVSNSNAKARVSLFDDALVPDTTRADEQADGSNSNAKIAPPLLTDAPELIAKKGDSSGKASAYPLNKGDDLIITRQSGDGSGEARRNIPSDPLASSFPIKPGGGLTNKSVISSQESFDQVGRAGKERVPLAAESGESRDDSFAGNPPKLTDTENASLLRTESRTQPSVEGSTSGNEHSVGQPKGKLAALFEGAADQDANFERNMAATVKKASPSEAVGVARGSTYKTSSLFGGASVGGSLFGDASTGGLPSRWNSIFGDDDDQQRKAPTHGNIAGDVLGNEAKQGTTPAHADPTKEHCQSITGDIILGPTSDSLGDTPASTAQRSSSSSNRPDGGASDVAYGMQPTSVNPIQGKADAVPFGKTSSLGSARASLFGDAPLSGASSMFMAKPPSQPQQSLRGDSFKPSLFDNVSSSHHSNTLTSNTPEDNSVGSANATSGNTAVASSCSKDTQSKMSSLFDDGCQGKDFSSLDKFAKSEAPVHPAVQSVSTSTKIDLSSDTKGIATVSGMTPEPPTVITSAKKLAALMAAGSDSSDEDDFQHPTTASTAAALATLPKASLFGGSPGGQDSEPLSGSTAALFGSAVDPKQSNVTPAVARVVASRNSASPARSDTSKSSGGWGDSSDPLPSLVAAQNILPQNSASQPASSLFGSGDDATAKLSSSLSTSDKVDATSMSDSSLFGADVTSKPSRSLFGSSGNDATTKPFSIPSVGDNETEATSKQASSLFGNSSVAKNLFDDEDDDLAPSRATTNLAKLLGDVKPASPRKPPSTSIGAVTTAASGPSAPQKMLGSVAFGDPLGGSLGLNAPVSTSSGAIAEAASTAPTRSTAADNPMPGTNPSDVIDSSKQTSSFKQTEGTAVRDPLGALRPSRAS